MGVGQIGWIVLLAGAGLVEWLACRAGQCLSEGVWAWGAAAPWLTISVVVVSLSVLGVHFVWPILKRRRR